jgi:predicted amidophosphoribosyltransferase
MNEDKRICRYCGDEIKNKAGYICSNCVNKLPYVRKLCAIGRAIKKGVKK